MAHHITDRSASGAVAIVLAVLALVTWSGRAGAVGAQTPDSLALDGRFVRTIEIASHSIFFPLPDHARALYGFANRLHVVTRARTLRAAFTFHEGGRWSEAERAETERHLRGLSFVVPDSVVATAVGNDSVDVRVVTHDNWTTSPEFGLESGGGQRYGSFALVERNLLGLGTGLSLAYRSDVTGISRVAHLEDGELFGSHWRTRLSYGENVGGSSRSALLALPFWADDAPRSAAIGWTRSAYTSDVFANGQLAASIPERVETSQLSWGVGHRNASGTIFRWVGGIEQIDRRLGASVMQPGAPSYFDGPANWLRIRRATLEWRVLKPHYLVVRGVDQMDRDEDMDLGSGVLVRAGYAPAAFGSSANEANGRVDVDLGRDGGRAGFGSLHASTQARLRPDVCDGISEVNARWVQQPRPDLTAVVGVLGMDGRSTQRDFQFTLGGISGLRAYPVHELTGTRLWRGNAEMRWVAARNWLQLVSIGGAAFWDSGRMWGPGSENETWHHGAGFGLRLSLPRSSLNDVARFDVSWPVSPVTDQRRGPVFSFGSGQVF